MEINQFNVSAEFITIDGMSVPILVCDRNLVLYYFEIRNRRDEIKQRMENNPDLTPSLIKVFKELKARIHRLEKAIYFKCEITGELRLLSSLVLYNDKIIFTREFTRIQKQIIKQQKLQQVEQNRETIDRLVQQTRALPAPTSPPANLTIEQKRQRIRERGKMTELERQLQDGKITLGQLNSIDKNITESEFRSELSLIAKSGLAAFVPEDQIPKIAMHNILLRRIWDKRLNM